ncbi:MAG: cytochrome C [Epsilonproteobacteria bacterium]|nr:cytochrome C [Campylobacterota bacterium]
MKIRFIKYLFFVAVICFIYQPYSYGGSIVNTVHNLSVSGPGTIKATSETRICVFCHIPHDAQPGVPLWNRSMPVSTYQMYDSHYLTQANYPIPTGLGSSVGTPGSLSRQCLSCHDGTVAIGSVYLLNGTIMGSNQIAMQGVNLNGTMPSTAAGYIGTNLAIHHPVGIEYDPSVTIGFGSAGSGTNPRTIELKNPLPTAPIKLYSYSGKNYVECESCHDPHIENYDFLRVTAGANNADKVNTTCISCHNKTSWTGSVHETQTVTYTDTSVISTYGSNVVSDLGCINCHIPHKAASNSKYLLRGTFSTTCYTGAASSAAGAPCHGTGAAAGGKNIESILPPNRPYGHPVSTTSNKHKDLEVLDPTSLQWSSNSEHATCVDCHNPHKARAGTHSLPSNSNGWYPQSPNASTNSVSNVLKGVTGVEPSWPSSIWTQPTTFTTLESASKEYQICFKCHSEFALGAAVGGVTNYTLSAEGTKITDQAWEFNPNNKSAHPVVVTLNNQTGSYTPKALASSEMKAPWTNVGNQTMYCSDCHGADDEAGGDPRGPHGSNYKYMLKGPGKYWPTNPNGYLWKLNSTDASDSNLFCNNCHEIYNNGWANNAHADMANRGGMGGGLYCVSCHVAVPHGSKRSRLIGYASDPAPYNYNGNSLRLQGFRKASGANTYTCSNCHNPSNPDP